MKIEFYLICQYEFPDILEQIVEKTLHVPHWITLALLSKINCFVGFHVQV